MPNGFLIKKFGDYQTVTDKSIRGKLMAKADNCAVYFLRNKTESIVPLESKSDCIELNFSKKEILWREHKKTEWKKLAEITDIKSTPFYKVHSLPHKKKNTKKNSVVRSVNNKKLEWTNAISGYIFNNPMLVSNKLQVKEISNAGGKINLNLTKGGIYKLNLVESDADINMPLMVAGKRFKLSIDKSCVNCPVLNWHGVLWSEGKTPQLNDHHPITNFEFFTDGHQLLHFKVVEPNHLLPASTGQVVSLLPPLHGGRVSPLGFRAPSTRLIGFV